MPDLFIPLDTSSYNQYYNKLRRNNIVYNVVLDYIDTNRTRLRKQYPNFEVFNNRFEVTDTMIEAIVVEGEKQGIERDNESLDFNITTMKKEIRALVARDIFSRNEFYQVIFEDDEAVLKALEVIENKERYKNLLVTAD